jgi:hypothetical protein
VTGTTLALKRNGSGVNIFGSLSIRDLLSSRSSASCITNQQDIKSNTENASNTLTTSTAHYNQLQTIIMSANNNNTNSSTLKSYVDSATGAVQNVVGGIIGSRGDEVSITKANPTPRTILVSRH